jgi:hypothetical protein
MSGVRTTQLPSGALGLELTAEGLDELDHAFAPPREPQPLEML